MKWQYKHTVLLLHFILWGCIAMDRLLPAFVAPSLVKDLGITFAEFGAVMSILAVTWAIFSLIGGNLSDRVGRVNVVVVGAALFSVTTLLTGFAANLGQLMGIRAAVGIGEGAYTGAGTAHIAEAWPPEQRGFALGTHNAAFPLFATFIGGMFAAWVSSMWGWRAVFPAAAVVGIIVAIIFWRFIHEPKSFTDRKAATEAMGGEEKFGLSAMIEVLKHRDLLLDFGVIAGVMIGYWTIMDFLTLYLTQIKGFDAPAAAGVAGILGVGGVLGQIGSGWFSDKFGRRPVLFVSSIGAVVGSLIIMFTGGSILLYVGLIILGFAAYIPFPICLYAIAADLVPLRMVGTAGGALNLVSEVVGIAGPIIAGALADVYGLPVIFWVVMGGYVLAGLFVVFMRETSPAKRAKAVAEAA